MPVNDNVIVHDWFTPDIEYLGTGTVVLRDPDCTITGETVARCGKDGVVTVSINVESIEPMGVHPLHIAFSDARCAGVTVRTPDGILTADDGLYLGADAGEGMCLRLLLNRSVYTVNGAEEPRYWVCPLTNLLTPFATGTVPLEGHPLRLKQVRELDEHRRRVGTYATSTNPIVHFEENGSLAFIEPLPDYSARAKRLEDGDARWLVTAVSVGDVSGRPSMTPAEIGWLPLNAVHLLTLATGSQVGIPWIEFRGADAMLARRMHVRYAGAGYSRGNRAIREELSRGCIGMLLTSGLQSPLLGQTWMRATMLNLAGGARHEGYVDDRLMHLCHALECVCRNQSPAAPPSLRSALSPQSVNAVKSILATAYADIRRLATALPPANSMCLDEYNALLKIGARAKGAWDGEQRLAACAPVLLGSLGLPDAPIIDDFIRRNQAVYHRVAGWGDAVAQYRNQLAHDGYVDHSIPGLPDHIQVQRHLLDVMLRVVFRLLGYDGEYCPAVSRRADSKPVDWVTPSTTADELGYAIP